MVSKRFIAGAICQNCGEQDKLRAWVDRDEKVMRRECVACSYKDSIALETGDTKEIQTRVNYTNPVFDDDVKPVRLLIDDLKPGS